MNRDDENVIKAVRSKYRICNYLITSAICWNTGERLLRHVVPHSLSDSPVYTGFVVAGWAMMIAAFAFTFAVYRCPVCRHFLKRFRPRKDQCGHCGAKVA